MFQVWLKRTQCVVVAKHSQSTLCYKRIWTSEKMWLHKDICSCCQVGDVTNSHGSSNKEQLANVPPYVKMVVSNGDLCEEVFTTQPWGFIILRHEDKVFKLKFFWYYCVRHLVFGMKKLIPISSPIIFSTIICAMF